FVEKLGAKPRRIASLYIGRHEGERLLYAGKAQSGYSEADAREVRERLDPLIRKDTPLSVPVSKPKATWVEPVIEAEIAYAGVTDDGLLRAPVFKELRDDLATATAAPSPPVSARVPHARSSKGRGGVPRENILQLLPDAVVPSKAELEAYWRKVGKRALHYLGGRPLKLVRHTRGTTFYHRGKLPPIPPGSAIEFWPGVLTDFGPASVPQPRVALVLPGGSEWIGTPEWNCSSSFVRSMSLVSVRSPVWRRSSACTGGWCVRRLLVRCRRPVAIRRGSSPS